MEAKPPIPPFSEESARQKVRLAEDAWNSRDPDRVALVSSCASSMSDTTLPSRESLVKLDPQQLSHVLSIWSVGRLATVGEDAAPHLVPIVFVWVDGYIYSPIDGKPKRGEVLQRLRNVTRHPSVSLLLDHYDTDWQALWWIRIDGTADVVSGDVVETPKAPRIVHGLKTKYPQYRAVDIFSGPPTLLRILPRHHTAWSAQPVAWDSLR